jgi:LacI family gluconate utilization system Gnt-I transcriptional repressor
MLGYGDLNFSAHTDPPLSTVRIDGTRIGTLAASMLIDRIENRRVIDKVMDVGFKLIERATA